MPGKTTKAEINKTVDFTTDAISRKPEEEAPKPDESAGPKRIDHNNKLTTGQMTHEEATLRKVRNMFEDKLTVDTSDGYMANLKVGSLGLIPVMSANTDVSTAMPSGSEISVAA